MTLTLIAYSALFGVWAGAAVSPPNYILCGSHIFNVLMQLVQLKRCLAHAAAPRTSPTPLETG